jgi:hypothetical protein
MTITYSDRSSCILMYRQSTVSCLPADSATTCAKTTKDSKDSVQPVVQNNHFRKVHFREGRNVAYETPVSKNERRSLWYTQTDVTGFKRDAACIVKLIRRAEKAVNNPTSWSRSLLQVYKGLSDATKVDDILEIFNSAGSCKVPATALGLERVVLHEIHLNKYWRRGEVVSQVLYWQNASVPNEDIRADKMRQASRIISRVSGLFAHHVALGVAAQC